MTFIYFNYNNQDITSSTISPAKPVGFNISDTIIYIDNDSFGGFFEDENNLEISWQNLSGEYFMLNIQLTDTSSLSENLILARKLLRFS